MTCSPLAEVDRRTGPGGGPADRGDDRFDGRRQCGHGVVDRLAGPHGQDLISNDQVAEWVRRYPGRFAAVAAVDLNRPMEAVRELRRRVVDEGFVGLRMLPWLKTGGRAHRSPVLPLYAECVRARGPVLHQVGHTGPLMPPRPGGRSRTSIRWPSTSRN